MGKHKISELCKKESGKNSINLVTMNFKPSTFVLRCTMYNDVSQRVHCKTLICFKGFSICLENVPLRLE
jgi:hypothetical protein